MSPRKRSSTRHLVLVLGDQLDHSSAAFDGIDPDRDLVLLAEVAEEATYVWSHKARIALFFSAMRHFRDELRRRGLRVAYSELDAAGNAGSLDGELARAVRTWRPERVVVVEPGEWRVREALREAAAALGVSLEIRPDRRFLCSTEEFAAHAAGRRQLRMEAFYHWMRRRHGVLLDEGAPAGGRWNYDPENRRPFGAAGPNPIREPRSFAPDETTREVLRLVARRFAHHPGSLARFDWPVTARQARLALDDFVAHRLADFGPHQDAMWSGAPFLYHSRISSALNLGLLHPRLAIERAERAWRGGDAPLASVEGFVRQILGWREYVRGIYWRFMPGYLALNALEATEPLPAFYWTGGTEMNCLRETLAQTLAYGYAHHIQRLMVTGLYALLLGVRPSQVHAWYLAIYVDAVEWVELPNVLGMSQFADGGQMASKPYAATGRYLLRMSDYCLGCRYRPRQSLGEDACPFTTLYWDFLMRHERRFSRQPRMAMQVRNLARLSAEQRAALRRQAGAHRRAVSAEGSEFGTAAGPGGLR